VKPLQGLSLDLASIGQRFAARLIDGLIFLVPYLALTVPLVEENTDGDLTLPMWTTWAMLAASAIYEVILVAVRGQTIGKAVMKVRVVRADGTGQLPSLGASAIRFLLPAVVAGIPVVTLQVASLLIYAWAIWDPNRQGLHDKAAGTVVVRA